MHLALPKCLLPPDIPINNWYALLCHVCHMSLLAQWTCFHYLTNIWQGIQMLISLITQSSPVSILLPSITINSNSHSSKSTCNSSCNKLTIITWLFQSHDKNCVSKSVLLLFMTYKIRGPHSNGYEDYYFWNVSTFQRNLLSQPSGSSTIIFSVADVSFRIHSRCCSHDSLLGYSHRIW